MQTELNQTFKKILTSNNILFFLKIYFHPPNPKSRVPQLKCNASHKSNVFMACIGFKCWAHVIMKFPISTYLFYLMQSYLYCINSIYSIQYLKLLVDIVFLWSFYSKGCIKWFYLFSLKYFIPFHEYDFHINWQWQ